MNRLLARLYRYLTPPAETYCEHDISTSLTCYQCSKSSGEGQESPPQKERSAR